MENCIEQLIKIYNTLLMVTTKGEDTVIMGQCLQAFHQTLSDLQKNMVAD
jgi:hypothetical protein